MPYWSQDDLEGIMGVATVLACFDDTNTGVVSATALLRVQKSSDAKIEGRLATEFGASNFPLSSPPEQVIHASLLFGVALSYRRRPEYVKLYGTKPMDEAEAALSDLVQAREFMTEVLGIASQGANAGGLLYSHGPRMTVDRNGHGTTGDF